MGFLCQEGIHQKGGVKVVQNFSTAKAEAEIHGISLQMNCHKSDLPINQARLPLPASCQQRKLILCPDGKKTHQISFGKITSKTSTEALHKVSTVSLHRLPMRTLEPMELPANGSPGAMGVPPGELGSIQTTGQNLISGPSQ